VVRCQLRGAGPCTARDGQGFKSAPCRAGGRTARARVTGPRAGEVM